VFYVGYIYKRASEYWSAGAALLVSALSSTSVELFYQKKEKKNFCGALSLAATCQDVNLLVTSHSSQVADDLVPYRKEMYPVEIIVSVKKSV